MKRARAKERGTSKAAVALRFHNRLSRHPAPERKPSAFMRLRPLWQCPKCGRYFANRNQSHACGRHDLAHHFKGKSSELRALFDAFVAAVRKIGPVRVLPEKTRVAFQVRMSFAQVTPRLKWLDGHLVLARRITHPRFRAVQTISPRNHVHVFRLTTPRDLDAQFRAWLGEAYSVGQQKRLIDKSVKSVNR